MSYTIKISSCNNIASGEIDICRDKLNILFGCNGTGKTIATGNAPKGSRVLGQKICELLGKGGKYHGEEIIQRTIAG